MPMDDDFCDCAEHGPQPITFVCSHIVDRASPETAGFVSFPAEDGDDLRDAWCEACEAYLQENGGEWVEGAVEVPGGIRIICAECYRRREADARLAGRRIVRQE
ncbi:hypothetical protein [Sphingomonas sanxanigenens]|uniref:Uncharacterized protein n=1 Tax=Sphingomonas sanxanigenens DSM 19645 = NX02 TaxID=1123269 RepID=W0A980_9SPHN|nr:hypothetical protein [Sphingomonas sanxanigenens]AHE52898.1 hypothetical protein NX02_05815 [Sphingomonas sanxanigenens DSM 19645 = NX02]